MNSTKAELREGCLCSPEVPRLCSYSYSLGALGDRPAFLKLAPLSPTASGQEELCLLYQSYFCRDVLFVLCLYSSK